MESAILKEDAVITAYRAHGWAYMRGISVLGVLAELTGRYHYIAPDKRVYQVSIFLISAQKHML